MGSPDPQPGADGFQGEPDCLVLVLQDATERFSAEERFERAFGANPAPVIICRLSDLRYVKVHQGFQEMTGYTRDDIVGRSVYEIDVLESAENKELAVERQNERRTIPQMESLVRLSDGSRKFVVIAGQPIEVGEEGCMLFTYMDLEPRKKVEAALRQSEERFSKAFRLTPVPTLLSALENFRALDVNEAFHCCHRLPGRGSHRPHRRRHWAVGERCPAGSLSSLWRRQEASGTWI